MVMAARNVVYYVGQIEEAVGADEVVIGVWRW